MLCVYAVFDSKAGAFLAPMYFKNQATAVRAFSAAVGDEGHEFHRFAEDYQLFELGTFDEEKGQFSQPLAPVMVVSAATVLASRKVRE